MNIDLYINNLPKICYEIRSTSELHYGEKCNSSSIMDQCDSYHSLNIAMFVGEVEYNELELVTK